MNLVYLAEVGNQGEGEGGGVVVVVVRIWRTGAM